MEQQVILEGLAEVEAILQELADLERQAKAMLGEQAMELGLVVAEQEALVLLEVMERHNKETAVMVA